MKKFYFTSLISISILLLGFTGCSKSSSKTTADSARAKEVIVYTYDSFAGEWGPGAQLIEKFEATTGYKLTLVDCGDAVSAFTRAILEKDNVQADVVVGVDNNLQAKAHESGIFEKYKPQNADKIINAQLEKELGGDWLLTPYDYSHFAMIYDSESSVPCPQSLSDLLNPVYEKKIILMDPRTSTPGLGFLSWTVAQFKDDSEVKAFWTALKPNILAMTAGWSEGWGMFSKGEAPLVISYTTSPAYNVEYDNDHRFKAVVFKDGHVEQVEGYGLLKNAPNPEGAKAFMDFLISEAAQDTLPLTQWMYPVNSAVKVPESYNIAAPVPETTLATDAARTDKLLNEVMAILGK